MFRSRGRATEPVDARRPGWRGHFRAYAPLSPDRHVLAADRLYGDDTTVPVLAKGKTDIGGVYVRDDRHSAAPIHPPRCSTIRATAVANIRERISLQGMHPRANDT